MNLNDLLYLTAWACFIFGIFGVAALISDKIVSRKTHSQPLHTIDVSESDS